MKLTYTLPACALALSALLVLPSLSRSREADSGITGRWFSDVTGETVEFARKSGGSAEVKFAATGNATLTGTDEKGATLKLSFKSGIFSSTDCYYNVVKMGRDRMGWSVVEGPATCPRGAFSRLEGNVALVVPPAGRPGTPTPPPRPEDTATNQPEPAGRPVRTVEQIAGMWTNNRDGSRIVIKRGFEQNFEFWHSQAGQGVIAPAGAEGAYRVSFNGSTCAVVATLDRGELSIDSPDRGCGFAGTYDRGER